MKATQFKFETDEPMNVSLAKMAVNQWERRRTFPIRVISITENSVIVELESPDSKGHNKSVNSLARILQRQLDLIHCVQSRLVLNLVG